MAEQPIRAMIKIANRYKPQSYICDGLYFVYNKKSTYTNAAYLSVYIYNRAK